MNYQLLKCQTIISTNVALSSNNNTQQENVWIDFFFSNFDVTTGKCLNWFFFQILIFVFKNTLSKSSVAKPYIKLPSWDVGLIEGMAQQHLDALQLDAKQLGQHAKKKYFDNTFWAALHGHLTPLLLLSMLIKVLSVNKMFLTKC